MTEYNCGCEYVFDDSGEKVIYFRLCHEHDLGKRRVVL